MQENIHFPLVDDSILDSLSEYVIYYDTNQKIQWANKTAADSLKLGKEEVIGRLCYEIWYQQKRPCKKCPVLKAIKSGRTQEAEITTPDGKIWQIRANPAYDDTGSLVGVVEIALDITESQKAIRESDELNRNIHQTSLIGFVKTRIEDGLVLQANENCAKALGFRNANEMVGKFSVASLYSPVQRDRLIELLKENGEVSDFEIELNLNDENVKHILLAAKIHPKQGYIQSAITDITKLKEAEKDLQYSKIMLQLVLDSIPVRVFWKNKDSVYLGCNKVFAEDAGVDSPDDIVGKTDYDLAWKKEEADFFRKCDTRVINSDQSEYNIIEPQLHADGTQAWLDTNKIPLHDDKGNVVGILGTYEDITKRKQAEEFLRKSERSYRNLVENISDGLTIVDLDQNLIFVNTAARKISGYSRKELIGMNLRKLIIPNDLGEIDRIKKGILNDKNCKSEISIIRKDKQTRHLQLSVSPYLNENDEIIGSIGIFSDITEIKLAEEERIKLEGQLEKAQRMESIGILAGGVAHDLNNILGPLVAYPELILRKLGDNSPVKKQIKMMGNCARDAADVIQDLLSLARRGRYEMIPVDLNEVIESYLYSANMEDIKSKNSKISVEINLDKTIRMINGSATHLLKLLMNLVVNAFDAMPDGGRLKIETSEGYFDVLPGDQTFNNNGDYAVFKIADTGIGIDKKYLKRIFEPYFSKKELGTSGSGLGLSVVYGILKDHKGFYDIVTSPGNGTDFILYFPITTRQALITENQQIDDGGTESILIVDDSNEQRMVASDLLASMGYKIEMAINGREAVKRNKEKKFDLILLDMIMEKDFDGQETYREIIKIYPAQKAIIVSGFSATGRVSKTMELGAGQYIKKPYTCQELCRAVREELDKETVATFS